MMELNQKFVKLVQEKIAAGEEESKIRKWIRTTLGKGKTRSNEIFTKIKLGEDVMPKPLPVKVQDVFAESVVKDGNSAAASAWDIRTLEELVDFHGVDLKVWEPVKINFNVWDGRSGARAEFKRRVEEGKIESLIEDFIKRAEEHAPKKWPAWKPSTGEFMYVLNIQDLHLSKLCWGEETGQDYDIKIAKQYYSNAVDDLMSKVAGKAIKKVVVIAGSDFFQTDTISSSTTKGTFVDSDSRWTKAFSEGCALMVETIEKLSSNYDVSVVQVGGNHDLATSYYLGLYLQAWFRNNDRVTVNCSAATRKYETFGNTLIGIAHGDGMKLTDLPLVMMRENQDRISQYKWMEFLTGHLHQDKQIEVKGVKVRISPALCPPDSWHDKNNYSFNIQTSQGLLYSYSDGLEAIYYSKPVN